MSDPDPTSPRAPRLALVWALLVLLAYALARAHVLPLRLR